MHKTTRNQATLERTDWTKYKKLRNKIDIKPILTDKSDIDTEIRTFTRHILNAYRKSTKIDTTYKINKIIDLTFTASRKETILEENIRKQATPFINYSETFSSIRFRLISDIKNTDPTLWQTYKITGETKNKNT